jgi:hypothetical protein
MTRALMNSNAVVFSSSEGSESSLELDRLSHGVYTYGIIQGVGGAVQKGRLTMVQLSSYVLKEVKSMTFDRHPGCTRSSSLTSP